MTEDLPQLSPREREVMTLIAQGKTDTEAAMALGISEHTVDNHVRRVFDKLGVHSRTAAIARLCLVQEDKRQLSFSL